MGFGDIAKMTGVGLIANAFGGGGGGGPDNSAEQNLGAVTANEWSTYMQHFVPYEDTLISYATNPNLPKINMDTALGNQESANAQGEGIQQRALAQTGATLTAEEQAAATKQRGISNVTANVNAANQAKDQTVANQMGILGTPQTGITGNV
jgi:hypothetical protein